MKCPYIIGQIVYAQYLTDEWILSKIVGFNVFAEQVKLKAINKLGSSCRPFGDRIKTLTREEETLLLFECGEQNEVGTN